MFEGGSCHVKINQTFARNGEGFLLMAYKNGLKKMYRMQIKRLDFLENIGYIVTSIPAAPLLKSMRNSVGFCFYRGFDV